MRRLAVFCCLFIPCCGSVRAVQAQAAYTATRPVRLQFGAGGLYLRNNFSPRPAEGVAIWGDLDFTRYIGLEAAVHFGGLRAPDHIGQRTYSVGPRLSYRRKRLNVFATLGAGQGTISNQLYHTSSTYNLVSYGAGLEIQAAGRLQIRVASVEVQRWLSFEPHGLAPFSVITGVSYVIP